MATIVRKLYQGPVNTLRQGWCLGEGLERDVFVFGDHLHVVLGGMEDSTQVRMDYTVPYCSHMHRVLLHGKVAL